MVRRIHAITCVVGLLLALPFAARPAVAGSTTGFAFLSLPAGARAAALGGAFTAVADDPSAIFWNPAGIAAPAALAKDEIAVTGMHHESIQNFRQDLVAATWRKVDDGLSLGFNAHYTGRLEGADELGNPLGAFGADDFAILGGYATTLRPGLRVGGALGWLDETIAGTTAATATFSFGALWQPGLLKGLTLGAALRNAGGSPSFPTATGGEGEPLDQPLTLAGGISLAGVDVGMRWLLTGEVSHLDGDDTDGRAGLEIVPADGLSVRVGWMFGEDAADLTAGAGLLVKNLAFDYAFVPYHDDLGSSHRAGLTARF